MPRTGFLVFLALLVLPAQATNSLDDYAYQSSLSESTQPLQRVVIPLEILLNLTRSDLGDIVVFNRNGKLLPHSIKAAADKVSEKSQTLPFHEFSRFQQQNSKTITTREQNQQGALTSELQTTETIPVQTRHRDYLIELLPQADSPKFDLIELEWEHQPNDQLLQLRIEAGNEIDDLRVIQSTKLMTHRDSNDRGWRSISGIPAKQKYLRLVPADSVTRFRLTQARGVYRLTEPADNFRHRMHSEQIQQDNEVFYQFSLPSAVQPESVKVIPAESHSLFNGDIYAASDGFEQRQLIRSRIRQHNIDDPEVKPSDPVSLPRRNYRHFWLRSESRLLQAPDIELAYPQYELLFLGDGNAPYTLAWGNYEAKQAPSDLSALLISDHDELSRGVSVELIDIIASGGPSRLAPAAQLPWQKWLLWALLILAALITGRMAIKLFREMNQQTIPDQD